MIVARSRIDKINNALHPDRVFVNKTVSFQDLYHFMQFVSHIECVCTTLINS